MILKLSPFELHECGVLQGCFVFHCVLRSGKAMIVSQCAIKARTAIHDFHKYLAGRTVFEPYAAWVF
jgi:hypothetical protein